MAIAIRECRQNEPSPHSGSKGEGLHVGPGAPGLSVPSASLSLMALHWGCLGWTHSCFLCGNQSIAALFQQLTQADKLLPLSGGPQSFKVQPQLVNAKEIIAFFEWKIRFNSMASCVYIDICRGCYSNNQAECGEPWRECRIRKWR